MVKKILSVLLCLVLVLGLAVSAAAAGHGGGAVRYSVIPFDVVSAYGGDGLMEYASYVAKEGVSDSTESNSAGLGQSCSVVTNDGSFDIRNYITCYESPSSIRLVAHNFTLRVADLKRFTVSAGSSTNGGVYARVRGSYVIIAGGNQQYHPVSFSFDRSSTDSIVDVGALISAELPDNNSIVCFEYLYLDLDGKGVSADGEYTVRMSSSSMPQPSVSDWIDTLELPIERISSGAVNLTDWLVDAIGGFLDFQLFPGMSLNGIIQFVVVIGMVFLLLTLLV